MNYYLNTDDGRIMRTYTENDGDVNIAILCKHTGSWELSIRLANTSEQGLTERNYFYGWASISKKHAKQNQRKIKAQNLIDNL